MSTSSLLIDGQAVRWLVLSAGLLILKSYFSNTWTGLMKVRSGTVGAPEDRLFGAKKDAKPWEALSHPLVMRAQRSVFNDQENIPLWFMTAVLFLLTGASGLEARNWFVPYVIARYLHTVAYLNEKQPHRAIFFILGGLLTLGPLFLSFYRAYVGF